MRDQRSSKVFLAIAITAAIVVMVIRMITGSLSDVPGSHTISIDILNSEEPVEAPYTSDSSIPGWLVENAYKNSECSYMFTGYESEDFYSLEILPRYTEAEQTDRTFGCPVYYRDLFENFFSIDAAAYTFDKQNRNYVFSFAVTNVSSYTFDNLDMAVELLSDDDTCWYGYFETDDVLFGMAPGETRTVRFMLDDTEIDDSAYFRLDYVTLNFTDTEEDEYYYMFWPLWDAFYQ